MISNSLSRIFGSFASFAFPRPIQTWINQIYVKIFKIDLDEFDLPQNYPTLNDLFTRKLKIPREFDTHPDLWISPCDCVITATGKVEHNMALQIKGMRYGVSELLGEVLEEGYSFLNFYLSPKDYHRYHAPIDMEVLEVRYFGGELLAVNRASLLTNHNLFIRNERVVVVAQDMQGRKLFYVAIGALNVGQMILHFEPKLHTNAKANINTIYTYDHPIKIAKGSEMGYFKMGSTIVLFASNIDIEINTGQTLKFGTKIGLRKER